MDRPKKLGSGSDLIKRSNGKPKKTCVRFGLKKESKKGKEPKEKLTPKQRAKKIGKILVTVLLIGIIIMCLVAGGLAIYLWKFVTPYSIDLSDAQLKFTTIVYGNNPNKTEPIEIAEISGSENRIWVDIEDTPEFLQNAIVAAEDKRFFEHEGVDIRRTVGATINYILYRLNLSDDFYGGSTITQQLVKNLEGNYYDRSLSVKLKEIVTAINVEQEYSKDQILECYMNTIPLGNNCYGVQTAAQRYFGKNVRDLDLAQCALLAGIIQSPNNDEPYNHMDKALNRQKYVLKTMLSLGMISQTEYDSAVAETITVTEKTTTVRSWFVDAVITDVENDLVANGICSTTDEALNMIYTQGLRIYTTQNTKIQADMDSVYTNMSYFKGIDGASKEELAADQYANYFQSSMMIVDYSGRVLGIEGARGAKSGNMLLDYTTTSRQPGSSIKPIGVYGLAIENGLINWSTIFNDSPSEMKDGNPWPHDDDPWTYQDVTVQKALEQSLNTVAIRIEEMLGSRATYNFLTKKLGFTTLTKNDASNIAIALGMIDNGVTVEEMAGAYEIYGNGGVYTKPYTYTKVVDANGNIILEPKHPSLQALSGETATIMNKIMQTVVQNGTGYNAKGLNVEVAGKTGTTSNNYDRWWCGITPNYVGVVWTGYAQPRSMGGGANPAVIIWRDVMKQVEADGGSASTFPIWGNVVQANYDASTGAVTASGSQVGWYKITDSGVAAATAINEGK